MSAYIFFNWAFSFLSSFKRLSWEEDIPPNFALQLKNVAWLITYLRQISPTLMPLSCCFRIEMILLSVKRDFFIQIKIQDYSLVLIAGNLDHFNTLSFFPEIFRPALQFCGSRSGRDFDKVAETHLNPLQTERGNIIFEEARLVLECRKIYEDDLKKKNFLLPEVAKKNYPKNDFHKFYIGEIVSALRR